MATILVVDDRFMNREFLLTLLQYAQHRVLEAEDGAQALQMIINQKPDLIITDILMPTMDGFALVRELKKDSDLAQIPVIFYTATYRLEEGQKLAESCGVQYVLSKPCDPEVILQTVNHALGLSGKVPTPVTPEKKIKTHIDIENRLVSVSEFTVNLLSERDPMRLFTTFCKGICNLIGARYAAVGIFHYSGEALKDFVEVGSPNHIDHHAIDGYIAQMKSTRKPLKNTHFVGAPIVTASHLYGFFYAKDKIEGTDFTEEDSELVRLSTSVLSLLYENIDMYDSIQRHAANLQVERARADDANRAKSVFLATISHELRTPLTAIIGYSEILQEMAVEQNLKTFLHNLDKIIYSSNHLLQLINDLLDLSKIEAGRMELYLEDVELERIVNDVESIIRPMLGGKKNTLTVTMDVQTNIMHTDVMRLRQSLINLLNNANKFTSNGKITLTISSNDSMVQFDIADTGMGISPEALPRLFQSFSQEDSSTSRKYGGSGLGLFLTKCFCEMLGGKISVKSKKGEGTVFTMMLPQRSHVSSLSLK